METSTYYFRDKDDRVGIAQRFLQTKTTVYLCYSKPPVEATAASFSLMIGAGFISSLRAVYMQKQPSPLGCFNSKRGAKDQKWPKFLGPNDTYGVGLNKKCAQPHTLKYLNT